MGSTVEAFQVLPVGEGTAPRGGILGRGRVLALRVRDGSMADEGIREGDYLLVQPNGGAVSGQTVVAEVAGAFTVKRFVREAKGRVHFESTSPDRPPLVLATEDVRIVGPVVGVFRRQGFRTPRPAPARPSIAEGHTLDLAVHAIGQALRAAEMIAITHPEPAASRIRELACSLRGLRDCYLETATPRLREALLQEASDVISALRRFGVEPRASA